MFTLRFCNNWFICHELLFNYNVFWQTYGGLSIEVNLITFLTVDFNKFTAPCLGRWQNRPVNVLSETPQHQTYVTLAHIFAYCTYLRTCCRLKCFFFQSKLVQFFFQSVLLMSAKTFTFLSDLRNTCSDVVFWHQNYKSVQFHEFCPP